MDQRQPHNHHDDSEDPPQGENNTPAHTPPLITPASTDAVLSADQVTPSTRLNVKPTPATTAPSSMGIGIGIPVAISTATQTHHPTPGDGPCSKPIPGSRLEMNALMGHPAQQADITLTLSPILLAVLSLLRLVLICPAVP
jgi:hypothetical protein